jgi:phage-related protein
VIGIPKTCQREIDGMPQEIREDLADVLARLEEGHLLSMPLSRPMASIGQGVHELRLRDRAGAYRVIYALVVQGIVHVLHAFKKTTRRTPQGSIELARRRLSEIRQRLRKEESR